MDLFITTTPFFTYEHLALVKHVAEFADAFRIGIGCIGLLGHLYDLGFGHTEQPSELPDGGGGPVIPHCGSDGADAQAGGLDAAAVARAEADARQRQLVPLIVAERAGPDSAGPTQRDAGAEPRAARARPTRIVLSTDVPEGRSVSAIDKRET